MTEEEIEKIRNELMHFDENTDLNEKFANAFPEKFHSVNISLEKLNKMIAENAIVRKD